MKILILATGFKPQYRVLRCAASAGHEVFVAGQGGALLLGTSRYCKGLYKCDLQARDQNKVVDFVNSLVAQQGIDAVLPSDAITTRLLARIRSAIACKVYPVPAEDLFEQLGNKDTFMALCSRLAVRHPRTVLVSDLSELKKVVFDDGFPFPFVIKSTNRSGGDGVFKVFNRSDLASIAKRIDYTPILIQEHIDGDDISLSLFCKSGDVVTAAVFQRDSRSFRCVAHDAFRREAGRIAAATRFDGVINFDSILTADGDIVFLECNPRFFYSMDLVMLTSGVNFVEIGLNGKSGCAGRKRSTYGPILLWKSVVLSMLSPWKIVKSDISFLKYALADPVTAMLLATSFDLRFPAATAALSGYALRRSKRAPALAERPSR